MAAVRVAGRTPTPRNRWGNSKVLNSLQTASPLLRTPGAHVTVSVNNDEEERKQRRLESHLRSVMSPSYTSSNVVGRTIRVRGGETASSSLSNTQIAEHYANCIKLSSENKINARNAFGLHLIDYMLEMLQKRGELSNFQVAGCTLDASAKIYASRVDSIYTDAYKVLGGLGRSGTQEQCTEVTTAEKPTSQATSKESSVATIERHSKALDLTCMDLEFGVDPLFKKMSATFDEGGDEGLLLHQLETCDDYSIVLDGSDVVCVEGEKVKSLQLNCDELQGLKMNEVNSLQICPTFASFAFTGDQSVGQFCSPDDYSGAQSELGCPQLQPDYSMLPCPTVPVDSESDDGVCVLEAEESVSYTGCEGDINEETEDSVALGSCGDGEVAYLFPNATYPVECPSNGVQPSWMGNLCLTDAFEPSEYSYFSTSIVTTWAGPQHWKLNSLKKQRGRKPEVVLSHQKQPFKISFGQMPLKKLFMKSKASTQLNAQSENMALPHDLCLELDTLFRLFCQQKWIIQRQRAVVQVEDQLDDMWYNYANPNDSVHYCPPTMQEEEPDESYDIRGHDGGDTMDGLAFSQAIGDCQESTEQFELVAQPRKVEKVSVEYARNAKKINAKKLKTKMWEVITSESVGDEEKKCTVTFSSVCIQLPQHVQSSTVNDISVPICFVFLLHLANDKGLNMTGRHDLSDFIIEH